MTISSLQTLLGQQPPPPIPDAVPRPEACALLNVAFHQRTTTLVAPAGSGKTELLRQWAATKDPAEVCWLTVTAGHQHGDRLLGELRVAFDAMRASDRDVVLVLDDFHLVADEGVAATVAAVIDTAPPRCHVIVSTRVEPPLDFYRRCLSGLRVELREDAVAFSHDEGEALLRRRAGTPATLAPADVADRLRQAEGWPTGIVLADEALADWFDEHVLADLPSDERRFLVETSVLRELTGPLCDVVLERTGGDAMLDRLRRRSLFLHRREGSARLSFQGQFRDHLRRILHEEDPALEVRSLVRAARWHLDHDEFDPAMAYLIDASAWQDAFRTAQTHAARLFARGEVTTVARWLAQVPLDVRIQRPDVLLLEAAARLFGGEPSRALHLVDAVEQATDHGVSARVLADVLRGYAALERGSLGQAGAASARIDLALEHLDRFDGPNIFGLTSCRRDVVAASAVLRGVGLVFEGRLVEARAALQGAAVGAHAFWQVSALGALGLLEAWSGRLALAEQQALQALAIAEELDLGRAPMTTSAHLAIAVVARERGDLDRASAFLDEASDRSDAGGSRLVAGAITVERALLAAASGDAAEALRLVGGLRDTDHPSTPPAVTIHRRTVLAWLLVVTGDQEGAERTIASAPRAETGDVAALRMRIALERGDLASARVIASAWPATSTPREEVEAHLWSAILEHAVGDGRAAREAMAIAVRDAEPDHDLGPFRSAGPHVLGPARALYRAAPSPFLREIVEQPPPPSTVRMAPELIEQLTHREYLVLSLLPTRLSNAEIAERLEVSLNTVKTHLKHIYRKLNVPGRREAVGSAEQLRLL